MNIKTEIILDKLRPLREKGLPELYSDSEYQEIVSSFGVTETEWRELKENLPVYIDTAKRLLRDNNLNEAVPYFEKAYLIAPNNLEILSGLSEINLRLWQQHPENSNYCDKSIFYAERCLSIDPNHEASLTRIAILKPQVSVLKTKSKAQIIALIAGILVAVLIAGLVLFLKIKSGGGSSSGFH